MSEPAGRSTGHPREPTDRACLFLDVDGTLIDLAPTPDAVVVPDGLVRDLARVEAVFGGALALVSGRSIADLDRLFAPVALIASGVHGAEIRVGRGSDEAFARAEPLPADVWDALTGLLNAFPGTLTENKAYSFAVHYRAVPESGPRLQAALERFLAEHADLGLQILPGHAVFELKRPGINKGAAIRALMEREPFVGRLPIFIGDDVTDAPGFTVVKELGGHGYSVGRAFPDVDGVFSGPAAVRAWLGRIGRQHPEPA